MRNKLKLLRMINTIYYLTFVFIYRILTFVYISFVTRDFEFLVYDSINFRIYVNYDWLFKFCLQ